MLALPAQEAGTWAAYIPQDRGGHHEQEKAPEAHPCFRRLDGLADLPEGIDRMA